MTSPPNVLARLRAGEKKLTLSGEGPDAVSTLLGVDRGTPVKWARRGVGGRVLPAFKIGRACYCFERDLEAFMTPAEGTGGEPATPAAAPAAVTADADLAAAGW